LPTVEEDLKDPALESVPESQESENKAEEGLVPEETLESAESEPKEEITVRAFPKPPFMFYRDDMLFQENFLKAL